MKKKNTRIRRRKYNSRKKFIFPLICLSILLGVSVVGVFAAIDDTFTDKGTGLKFKVLTEEPDTNPATGTVAIVGYDSTLWSSGKLGVPATVTWDDSDTPGDPNDTQTDITYKVTEIDDSAFTGYKTLTTVQFAQNSNLTTIGKDAFKDCTNLDVLDFTNASALTTIGSSAFSGCTDLTNLDLKGAEKLTTIDASAFSGCSALQTADLSAAASLENLNDSAFSSNSALTSVALPSSLQKIGKSAFRDCTNLHDISVGANSKLASINESAFHNCPWLTVFPNLSQSSATIASGAFWGCCYLDSAKFPANSDPFNKSTILQYLDAQLRGTSIKKIIPSAGAEDTDVTKGTSVPKRFFKGQKYDITFDPADGYQIEGLDLLTREEVIPTSYAISSEFDPRTAGGKEYAFEIPSDWDSSAFVIFAAATNAQALSGAPTIITETLPHGLVNTPYEALLECNSETDVKWSASWESESGKSGEGLPPGLYFVSDSGTSTRIAGTPETETEEHYTVYVTATNSVSTHKRGYDLYIYDKSLSELKGLKWKEESGTIYAVWSPLQEASAASIDYTIRVYDEEGTCVGTVERPLPGTEFMQSEFAKVDVTSILEDHGKGVYTFTVTAESNGYGSSFANSANFEKGYYAYGYENYTITATATGAGYGKIALSSASYDIPSLKAEQITGGLKVVVREGAVTSATPLSLIFTPDAGCEITSLTVDGNAITGQDLGSYTFNDLPESTDASTDYDREVIVEFGLVDNTIGGEIVEKTSYIQGEKAAFEALGHNMDAVGEVPGATRWEPKYWYLDDSTTEHHWEGDIYTDTIDTTNLAYGDHTLYVTFRQQKYVADMGWQDVAGSHAVDTRSVSFTVTDKSGEVPVDPSGDDPSGGDTSGGDTSGGGTSGGDASGTSGGTSGGGSGGIVDTITSYAAGVATGDNMALGMWSALALVSLCGIGFCIRQMFRYA